jgi:hypothetical protein
MMKPAPSLPALLFILTLSGCTNYLYQGELSGMDAYDKPNRFTLYWPKTEPLIGRDKAGPAILMTDCSTTRIDFSDQPEGIVFRGEPDRDRLAGATTTVTQNQICGKFIGPLKLAEVQAGALAVAINCEPMPADEFAAQPRNYPKAKAEPYIFQIVEKIKRWSWFGETLPGPEAACTN